MQVPGSEVLEQDLRRVQGDRDTAKTELAAVSEHYGKVKDRCIAKPETYKDRKARVHKLLTNSSGAATDLMYEKGDAEFTGLVPETLWSECFSAGLTQKSLLAQYRPVLMHLLTTSGEHCTGEGIKFGEGIGGKNIDLEWVQVHQTSLVKPDDSDAKSTSWRRRLCVVSAVSRLTRPASALQTSWSSATM